MISPHHFHPTNGVRPSDSYGSQSETAMDLANNRAGRSVNDGTDSLTHCLGLLRAGELQIRPGGLALTSISPLY
jgi:hypothetical protein